MAARPLRLEELAEVLAFDFDDAPGGIPKLNADWRREDQERAVLSTCSSLITIVHDEYSGQVVQFSHFSVKEFLTSDRLAVAAEDISFYHIAPAPAHATLAQACLGVLLRLDDTTWEAFAPRFPLAAYAYRHWVDHALFESVSLHIKNGIEDLFDLEKPHFLRWINIRDMDDYYRWSHWETRQEQHEAAPMYYAAFCGLSDLVEKLIGEHPEHINTLGGPCGAAFHAAARMNRLNVIQTLLRHGADVNAPGLWGRKPFQFASVWGHVEVGQWLLDQGVDVNAKDELDRTSLHLAANAGHYEMVKTLLKQNADSNARDTTGLTPLHLTSNHDIYVDITRLLLTHGADPKARDNNQKTPLHVASSSGRLKVTRLLLEHGADVDARDVSSRTAYQMASDGGYDEVAQLLLARGVENSRTDSTS